MAKKGARVAKKRARRRARREERLLAEARLAAFTRDDKGYEGRTTGEIVGALAALGIEATEPQFRELAAARGKVEAIAEAWEQGGDLPQKWEHITYFAARALWPRWAPDLFAPEVFLHEHFPDLLLFDEFPTNREAGRAHWRAARATLDLVAPPDGTHRADLFEQLDVHAGYDLGWWMGELPTALADPEVGMVAEAVELCRRMAPVSEAEHYLGALGVVLIESGQRDEAYQQVQENLARFPEGVWVRIKAGDVYARAGEPVRAEALYREAYDLTDAALPSRERYDAVQRLLALYQATDRQNEYVTLAAAESDLIQEWELGEDADADEADEEGWPEDEPWDDDEETSDEPLQGPEVEVPNLPPVTVRRSVPKVGRNDPCPCGSGKKYKRCCAA